MNLLFTFSLFNLIFLTSDGANIYHKEIKGTSNGIRKIAPCEFSWGLLFNNKYIMEKKSFLFYLSWKKQLDDLDDIELRRFIYNLIKYHEGEEIDLPTKTDRLAWNGILTGLEINQDKYEKRVQANRENGKLGGAPKGNQNASKEKSTENNPERPKQPDKREMTTDNSKLVNGNRELENDNSKKEMGKEEMKNGNNKTENKSEIPDNAGFPSINSTNSKYHGGMSMYEFNKQRGLPY